MVSRVGRGAGLEDVSEGKKYLEEVMGIVEDEEFNRKRKLKALLQQKPTTGRLKRAKTETEEENFTDLSDSDQTWCGTKVRIIICICLVSIWMWPCFGLLQIDKLLALAKLHLKLKARAVNTFRQCSLSQLPAVFPEHQELVIVQGPYIKMHISASLHSPFGVFPGVSSGVLL